MVAPSASSTGTHQQTGPATSSPTTFTGDPITIGVSDTLAVIMFTSAVIGGAGHALAAAVALGGVAMSVIPAFKINGFGGTDADGYNFGFFLRDPAVSPGTGSKNFVVTMSGWAGATAILLNARGFTYTGAIDAATFDTAVTNAANGVTSRSTALPNMVTGDLGIGLCSNGSSAPAITTGTSDYSNAGSTSSGTDNVNIGHNSGTGTVSLAWSTNGADESAASGIRIIAAAASTKAPAQRRRRQLYAKGLYVR